MSTTPANERPVLYISIYMCCLGVGVSVYRPRLCPSRLPGYCSLRDGRSRGLGPARGVSSLALAAEPVVGCTTGKTETETQLSRRCFSLSSMRRKNIWWGPRITARLRSQILGQTFNNHTSHNYIAQNTQDTPCKTAASRRLWWPPFTTGVAALREGQQLLRSGN